MSHIHAQNIETVQTQPFYLSFYQHLYLLDVVDIGLVVLVTLSLFKLVKMVKG